MASNPYSTQTIASYNASPPPDDGSQVAANKVTWAFHKTKLADPIKTLAEAINTTVLAAFGTLVMTTDAAEESVVLHMQNFYRR